MIKTTHAAIAVLLITLLSACFPSKSYFGYTLHGISLEGDYNCSFISIEGTFKGEEFHEPYYVDVIDRGIYGQKRTHHPGEPNTGGELHITLECFDENEQKLGASHYGAVLINATTPSNVYIHNFTPDDVDSSECVAPTTYDRGPHFCVTMHGFRPIPPNG